MDVVLKKLAEIRPYPNNPRRNDDAVDAVAASIREFGWKQPIVVDRDGVIVAGHTRYKAAQRLGLTEAPCVIADDLTEEQVRAYRLADNKTAELAGWDFDLQAEELAEIAEIDMSAFGFDLEAFDDGSGFFSRENRNDDSREEGNEEYNEFLEKFESKKTTDDCYTPDGVYDAVADWVAEEYGLSRENFVRPFYPGGDYQRYTYGPEAVVVDNPPFSILAEILIFYKERGIRFFLFAPTLTLFSSSPSTSCAIPCGVRVIYENGASVNTSFLTSLEDDRLRVRTAPSLYKAVDVAVREYAAGLHKELPKFSYPDEIITSAMVGRWNKYGIDFRVTVDESEPCTALDAQKKVGKAIYGKGYLLSERAAAERAAAERAAAERAAAERAAAERAAAERAEAHRWELSEREKEIVKRLSEAGGKNRATARALDLKINRA